MRKSPRLPPTAYSSFQNRNAASFPQKCLCPQFPNEPRSLTDAECGDVAMSPSGEVEQRQKIKKKTEVLFGVDSGKVLSPSLIKVQHFHAAVEPAMPQYHAAFIEAART